MHNYRSSSSKGLIVSLIVTVSIATAIGEPAHAVCQEKICYDNLLSSYFYIGADAQLREMPYKFGFGDNLFRQDSPQGNVYLGVKLNCNLALEGGFEKGQTRTRQTTFSGGETVTGMVVPPELAPATFKNVTKISGPHLNLVGYYTPKCISDCFRVIGSVGIVYARAKFTRATVELAGRPRETFSIFSDYQIIPRVMAGIQYMYTENLSIRGTVTWENTRILEAKTPVVGSAFPASVKPKDSIVAGLGLVWYFD